MRLIMIKLLLFLLALLVAVILVAPQVDLDPLLPMQAGYLVALLLIFAVVTRSASPLALSALTPHRYNSKLIISGSPGLTLLPLRC